MWRHLYKKENAPSDEEIKNAIKEYFAIKNDAEDKSDRIKILQQKIHQYLDEKGFERVFGDEGYITRRVSEKKSYDLEQARKILEPLGLWEPVLKADEKKLEKILKDLPADRKKELESVIKDVKEVSTLTISRKKIEDEEEAASD